MTWNHRVIRHEKEHFDSIEVWFGIHECIYDNPRDEIPTSWTADAIAPVGEDMKSLSITIERYKECLSKPVLMIDGDKLKAWKP